MFGSENAFEVGGKILHKLGGDVSSGIGYRCVVATLLADLIEGGEERVGADQKVLVFFGAVLEAAHENRGGEAGIVQDAAANQDSDFAGRSGVGKVTRGKAAGFGELALVVPAAQAVEFIAADFHVHIVHGNEVGKRGDLVLRGEDDVRGADGIGEAEFFEFSETLGEGELFIAVDARIGDGLVKSDSGRPLGDGIFALAAFVEADVNGMDFIEQVGGALDEEIGEAGSGTGVDESGAMLGFKFMLIAKLFDLEGVAGEVGAKVEIAGTKAQCGAKNNFVKHRGGGIDDELAAAGGADDCEEIAGIHLGDGNGGFFAEKTASASGVAVTTPDVMALAFEKLGQEGAGRTRSENEDSHVLEECITGGRERSGRSDPQSVISNQ